MTWHLRDTRQMRGNKYGAKRTTIDNLTFDSKHEAKRWTELKLLERAGQITDLLRQVKFPIAVNGHPIGLYVADFAYIEKGQRVVEDSKGVRTDLYRWKRKLVKAVHGVDIVEV
jgi:hypothetical protein